MKNRIGTDLIEVARVRDSIKRLGSHFLNRIYTSEEQAYCESRGVHRYECYAARFAAKEAFSKAMGTGIGEHVSFDGIEVVHNEQGKPSIRLHGTTAAYFEKHFTGAEIDVSLTHTGELALATVIVSM